MLSLLDVMADCIAIRGSFVSRLSGGNVDLRPFVCGMRSRILVRILLWRNAKDTEWAEEFLGKKAKHAAARSLSSRQAMSRLCDILWSDCIRALRRAGFVCAAESPAAVVLVNAGRSVFLQRVPALNENAMLATLHVTRLSAEEFLALLGDEP